MPALYRIHEEPDPLKVEQFEEFICAFGYSLGAPPTARAAAALPEAGRADPRQAGRAADRVPDAADDAEGALRPGEPRPLRPGGGELHALHVADPPLSGPGRAPRCCASCATRKVERRAHARSSTRTCRRSAGTPPRWSAAPTMPSASCCSGRRSGSWPTRSAMSSTATSPASRRSACSSSSIEHFVEGLVHVSTMADDYYRFASSARAARREHQEAVPARRPGARAGRPGRHGAPADRSRAGRILEQVRATSARAGRAQQGAAEEGAAQGHAGTSGGARQASSAPRQKQRAGDGNEDRSRLTRISSSAPPATSITARARSSRR